MKKLLVLAAGLLQLPVIRRAREMGYYVIAADADSRAVGLREADKAFVADICSEEVMLRIAREEKIDGIIHPCTEVAMNVMGRINEELHLSGISRATALQASNKHLMREAFRIGHAPSPKSLLCADADHAWCLLHDEIQDDAILKPTRSCGSRGITKVEHNIAQPTFEQYYHRALQESRDHSVVIEQFIDGPEFSVEAIVWRGEPHILAVTDKKTTAPPFFVELGHNQPSVFPPSVQQQLIEAALAGMKALNLDNCAAHCELKLQNGQPYLMEIGARLGGDFITTVLTPLSTGIDIVGAAISVALGEEPDLQPKAAGQGVCIRYFTPQPGMLVGIENEHLLNASYVYDASIYRNVGDIVPEVRSSLDRSGHIIVLSSTPGSAIEKAEKIVEEVEFLTIQNK